MPKIPLECHLDTSPKVADLIVDIIPSTNAAALESPKKVAF